MWLGNAWNYFNPWVWVGNGDKLQQKDSKSMEILEHLFKCSVRHHPKRRTFAPSKLWNRSCTCAYSFCKRIVCFSARILAMISRKALEHVFVCPSAELDCWKVTPAKRRKIQDWEVGLKHQFGRDLDIRRHDRNQQHVRIALYLFLAWILAALVCEYANVFPCKSSTTRSTAYHCFMAPSLSSGSCSLVWKLCWCHSGLLQALHG